MSLNYGKIILSSKTFMKSSLGYTRFKSSTPWKFKNIFAGKSKLRSIFTSKFFATEKKIKVIFIIKGERIVVTAVEDTSFLDIVKNNELKIPNYGVCDAALDCSTCMLIFKSKDYPYLSFMTDDESDLLDTFPNLSQFARLGCQVCVTNAMDGIEVIVPEERIDKRNRHTNGTDKNGTEKNGAEKGTEKNGTEKKS